MPQFKVSRIVKPTVKVPTGLIEVAKVTADTVETDTGVRELGKTMTRPMRIAGVCFYEVEEGGWGKDDTRKLVAFFPGTEWGVEEV